LNAFEEAVSKQRLTLREIDRLIAEKICGIRPCKEWKLTNLGSAGGPVLIHGDWMKQAKHDYECYPDIDEVKTIHGMLGGPARYTTEIAAAWQVVDKMLERGFGVLMSGRAQGSGYEVALTPTQSAHGKQERAAASMEATAALAIGLVALKAYGVDVEVAA
jgi:hypothetical protein